MKLKRLLWIFLCFLSDQAAPCQVRCGLSDKWPTYFKNHFHTSDLSQLTKIASFNARWTLSSSQKFSSPPVMIDIQKWQALQMKVLSFPGLYVFITNLCHVGNLMHFDLNPIPPCEGKTWNLSMPLNPPSFACCPKVSLLSLFKRTIWRAPIVIKDL